jgi:hypothetical protein
VALTCPAYLMSNGSDMDNHFTRRDSRLAKFFNDTLPTLSGLQVWLLSAPGSVFWGDQPPAQEPYGGQMIHLKRMLSPTMHVVGDEARRHSVHAYQVRLLPGNLLAMRKMTAAPRYARYLVTHWQCVR